MTTDADNWKSLDRRLLLSARPWLDVYQGTIELPSGRRIDGFYRVVLPEFAVAVPVTPDGRFVLVKGYKHGLGRLTLGPPAGLVEPGEAAPDAARRELAEETGYTSDEWEFLGKHVVDGNRQCGTMHTYRARNARLTRPAAEHDAEQLRILLYTRSEVVDALATGEFGTLAGAGAMALALVLAPG